jgi:hypothetical protein
MTDEWQQEVSDRMNRLRHSLEALRAEKKLGPDPRRRVDALTKEVNELIRVVDEDKSKGVHNFVYAQALIGKAEEKVVAIKKSISPSLE